MAIDFAPTKDMKVSPEKEKDIQSNKIVERIK